jgi:hypothetical protein
VDEQQQGIAREKIEELRQLHGRRVRYLESAPDLEWAVVLKPPAPADFKLFKHQNEDPSLKAEAQDILCRKMIVAAWTFDSGDCDVLTLIAQYPGVTDACGEALLQLCGMKAVDRSKG